MKSKRQPKEPLTFKKFSETNRKRCEAAFGKISAWSPSDWGNALAGETGEACNFIKKLRRGQNIPLKKIAWELADILCYVDLLSARLGIDLEAALIEKFNKVSKKKNCKIKL